ncbi:hypothetical protein H7849_04520 [Alloacidobacterium dinghuense]|uniref:Uncharacterized protein n=1 Tax=Alloacidobacterium dinghuense TaxID=2763107 RepID=A0A7G8BL15_9BACT|nr:hypothetical protein [Alloacidobacterium dinghuense]QNI33235.1 hypothetical protein H7849_04520 [Alloacidobacterium dinghuense]
MENYFNYFTEIEEHFQRRRGSLLLLSTLDWALIETWREAGVPLTAVLRGIDAAFDKYESRKSRTRVRRVNGLAYCTQEVMTAVEEMQEASVGASPARGKEEPAPGFEADRIANHLESCASALLTATLTGIAEEGAHEMNQRLRGLATGVRTEQPELEELERTLTVLEEKLFALLLATTAEADLTAVREQASRELAPYRRRMQAVQIRQIEQQFLHKRLLEKYRLPRFSLFYMSQL